MSSALNWFEIPVTDLTRANRFYSALMQAELRQETMEGTQMAILPYQQGGVGGALVRGEAFVPSNQGVVVYLNAGDDLDGVLARVEPAGGKVSMGKRLISEKIGSIALIVDTEGNRIGLHSPR
ncbi:MAG: VOC family protein [Acidobacteriota bacterium]|nr:VOC family protein [Acidobacteriota bacterium]